MLPTPKPLRIIIAKEDKHGWCCDLWNPETGDIQAVYFTKPSYEVHKLTEHLVWDLGYDPTELEALKNLVWEQML